MFFSASVGFEMPLIKDILNTKADNFTAPSTSSDQSNCDSKGPDISFNERNFQLDLDILNARLALQSNASFLTQTNLKLQFITIIFKLSASCLVDS